MNRRLVHDRQFRPRTYRGEAEAADLLNWLNARKCGQEEEHARDKVARVIALVQSMREQAQTLARRKPSEGWLRDQNEVYEFFLEYTYSDRVDYDGESGLKWSVCHNREFSLDDVDGQAEAMATIRDLDKMGKLAQVRKCECGRYFFDRFPNRRPRERRFCSTECRERFWEQSPDRQEQKRDWAKDNYKSRKELQLGSRKAAAQRKGGKK
jgi:hypothetical protein